MRVRAWLLVLWSTAAWGSLLPALKPGLTPLDINLIDERDQSRQFQALSIGDRPLLLLPAFMKCHASCPVMTMALKSAIKNLPPETLFRVAIVSFDPSDRRHDLEAFRKEQDLPKKWDLFRVRDHAQSHQFFDQFSYRYQNDQGTFLHPNQIFVFSPRGKWSGIISGSTFDSRVIEAAVRQARLVDASGPVAAMERLISNPQNWAISGGIGLALSIALLVGIRLFRQ